MAQPSLDIENVRRALDEVAASPPFVTDRFGLDRFLSAAGELQRLLGSLYVSDPTVFWAVMTALVVLALGLGAHMAWSLWVLYRSVIETEETGEAGSRERDFVREAKEARRRGEGARVVQLCWFALCSRSGVSIGDTPGRQLELLEARRRDPEALRRLRSLYERALYSGAGASSGDADAALDALREAEHG